MSRDKQNENNCVNCIHNLICEKLEEFRDPLHWVNTEGEFVCSYYDTACYDTASDVAEEIFAEIEELLKTIKDDFREIGDIREAVGIRYSMIRLAQLKKKYIGEDTNVTTKESEKDNG